MSWPMSWLRSKGMEPYRYDKRMKESQSQENVNVRWETGLNKKRLASPRIQRPLTRIVSGLMGIASVCSLGAEVPPSEKASSLYKVVAGRVSKTDRLGINNNININQQHSSASFAEQDWPQHLCI